MAKKNYVNYRLFVCTEAAIYPVKQSTTFDELRHDLYSLNLIDSPADANKLTFEHLESATGSLILVRREGRDIELLLQPILED